MKKTGLLLLVLIPWFSFAQNPAKKIMDPSVFEEWKTIKAESISDNGQWVVYDLVTEGKDAQIYIHEVDSGREYSFARGQKGKFTADNQFVVFHIAPAIDSTKMMRRQKVKKHRLPTDTLALFNLETKKLRTYPDLKSFKIPKKWGGWIAYKKEKPRVPKKDSTRKEIEKIENDLIIKHLASDYELRVPDVTNYVFAEEGSFLLLSSESEDSTFTPGVYRFDFAQRQLQALFRNKGVYKKLCLDETGKQAAFLADLDTTKSLLRPFELYYWNPQQDSAYRTVGLDHPMLPQDWLPSEFYQPAFSKDGSRLFFGINPPPILKDTTLLPEEIVNVEVWNYKDGRLHTQQKIRLKNDQEKSYLCVWHLPQNRFVQLGKENIPEVRINRDKDASYALGYNEKPYQSSISWEGFPPYKDLYRIDLQSGQATLIQQKVKCSPRISPTGKYFIWYDSQDTAWYSYDVFAQQSYLLTNNQTVPFYDELNDRPMLPTSYGIAGWLENDAAVLINDRYDIWQVDPRNQTPPKNITKGRTDRLSHRYIRLDPEAKFIAKESLVRLFNQSTKASGYALINWNTAQKKGAGARRLSVSISPGKSAKSGSPTLYERRFSAIPGSARRRSQFAKYSTYQRCEPPTGRLFLGKHRNGAMDFSGWTSAQRFTHQTREL